MKAKNAYRQEMDQVRLSEEKKNETLQRMLEKNQALRKQEAERTGKTGMPVFTRRILPVFAAAAACIALVLFALRPSEQVVFASVRVSELPVSGVSRGEDAWEADFEAAFGRSAESLFPGWTVSENTTLQQAASSSVYESRLKLEKQGTALDAAVTQAEPALYTAVGGSSKGLDNARLNLDPETGVRTAACRCGDLFVCLSSGTLSEKEFLSAVKEITEAWEKENR